MILVADVGATNTRFAWASREGQRVDIRHLVSMPSRDAAGFEPLLLEFLAEHPLTPEAAVFGVPGPVTGPVVRTTNLPWLLDRRILEDRLGVPVLLLNDVEAAAHGLDVLRPEQLLTLQEGSLSAAGARALVSPGTGLGEAFALPSREGWLCAASEGGHTDFGAADEEDVALWRFLGARHGHVSYERIVSGPGLVALYEFHSSGKAGTERLYGEDEDPAVAISRAAAEGRSELCRLAVGHWWRILAREAANFALKVFARGGVYLAGGMPSHLLSTLVAEDFVEVFVDKGRYRELLSQIPLQIVLDSQLGLRGAACALRCGRTKPT